MRVSSTLTALVLATASLFAHAEEEAFQLRPEIRELMRLEAEVRHKVCSYVLLRQSVVLFKMATEKELFTEDGRREYLVKSTTSLYRSVLFDRSSAKASEKVTRFARTYAQKIVRSEDSSEVHQTFCSALMATAEKNGTVTAEQKEKAVEEAVAVLKKLAASSLEGSADRKEEPPREGTPRVGSVRKVPL